MRVLHFSIDLVFASAISLALAFILAYVLVEYTAVTWWQVLALGAGFWVIWSAVWWRWKARGMS